jgi:hypothetical protein
MALVLLNNNGTPLGQFDGYDNLAPLGGEVAKLVGYGTGGSDKHAKDIDDGYAPGGLQNTRPAVSLTLDGNETGGFFLTDDGTANYGTLFGTLVGGHVGQTVTGGTVLGPNTMSGSGKVTLWMNPGLYGVTVDALDATLAASTSLTVGTTLSYTAAGKLCLAAQKVGSAPVVARFVEFSTGDTLVTTPRSLTRVGVAGGMLQFKHAVISWNPPVS